MISRLLLYRQAETPGRSIRSAWLTLSMIMLALILAGCSREKADKPSVTTEQTIARVDTSPAAERLLLETPSVSKSTASERLPRLVDLGKGTCIPCKKMAPLLDELKKEYEGKAVVEVIDLRDDRGAAREYGIRLIPTQIFFDAEGNEVWRHEGFLAKDAIIAKFTEMGVPPVDN